MSTAKWQNIAGSKKFFSQRFICTEVTSYKNSQRLKFKKSIEIIKKHSLVTILLKDFVLFPSSIIQIKIVFPLHFHEFFDNLTLYYFFQISQKFEDHISHQNLFRSQNRTTYNRQFQICFMQNRFRAT